MFVFPPLRLKPSGFQNERFYDFKSKASGSTIHLTDLIMVNVYDHSAEFISKSSIDLYYAETTYNAKVVLMSSWINKTQDILRAQWFCDDEAEQLFGDCTRQVERVVPLPRSIDFERCL